MFCMCVCVIFLIKIKMLNDELLQGSKRQKKQGGQCLFSRLLSCSNITALKCAVTYQVFIIRITDVTVHDTSGTGSNATEDVTCANIDRVFLPNGQVFSENGVI